MKNEYVVWSTNKQDYELEFICRCGLSWYYFGKIIFAIIEVWNNNNLVQNSAYQLR